MKGGNNDTRIIVERFKNIEQLTRDTEENTRSILVNQEQFLDDLIAFTGNYSPEMEELLRRINEMPSNDTESIRGNALLEE